MEPTNETETPTNGQMPKKKAPRETVIVDRLLKVLSNLDAPARQRVWAYVNSRMIEEGKVVANGS
jgi:hypothetical protein